MSFESAREWLSRYAPDLTIIETSRSTATVLEAAEALGVEPGRIAKTLALRLGEKNVLVVTRGDARLDNGKTKASFGVRPRMLPPEETLAITGHPVGGVCPFGLANPLPIFLDVSLQSFDPIFPAAGSLNSSVRVSPARLAKLLNAEWTDICSVAGEQQQPSPGAEIG